MSDIIRNRTIRPYSRLETSKSYKIDTKVVSSGDTLIVNIDHESKSFRIAFHFKGSDITNKDSISFRVKDFGTHIEISWSGTQPIETESNSTKSTKPIRQSAIKTVVNPHTSKKSLAALASNNMEILILGTLPGDRSLELGEYYAHPRNRFWKIIAALTKEELPITYEQKKKLLNRYKIGLWDVAKGATRKGSLDANIFDVIPNNLDEFLSVNKKIKVIGFNGGKANKLFASFFSQKVGIVYLNLASTSPANAGISFEKICKQWQQIFQ